MQLYLQWDIVITYRDTRSSHSSASTSSSRLTKFTCVSHSCITSRTLFISYGGTGIATCPSTSASSSIVEGVFCSQATEGCTNSVFVGFAYVFSGPSEQYSFLVLTDASNCWALCNCPYHCHSQGLANLMSFKFHSDDQLRKMLVKVLVLVALQNCQEFWSVKISLSYLFPFVVLTYCVCVCVYLYSEYTRQIPIPNFVIIILQNSHSTTLTSSCPQRNQRKSMTGHWSHWA